MNVMQILPDLNAGGVERTTVEMVEALVAAGHGAHVVSNGGRLVADIDALGGTHHTVDIGSKNVLSVPWRVAGLRRLFHDHKIDVVHARSRAPAWPALLAARAEGLPFVTTYHGIYNAKTALKRGYNAVMAKGDIVIANSEFTRAHILKTHGTDSDKIVVIPRGVDMAQFDPTQVDPAKVTAMRKSWGVPPSATAIVLPGRLTRWKGQLVALDAMLNLPERCHLVLVGDAQGRTDYIQEIESGADLWGCADRVHMPGHCVDMPTVYAAADIVICPSTDPEAFGRTAAEAQAMGKPVIASDHGGAIEVVVQGETGWRVPPGDAKALAEAIGHVDALTGVATARDRIAAQFSKSALQSATLAVYGRAAGMTR